MTCPCHHRRCHRRPHTAVHARPPVGPGMGSYPARLDIDYPERLNRVTTLFRIVLVIPIAIVYGVLVGGNSTVTERANGDVVISSTASITGGLFFATLLMLLFRKRYPKWWFDFVRELTRFATRVGAYVVLLTDMYPSTVDEQAVHLEIDYPDAERDLMRGMPLVKWFLAIPHYIVLFFLGIGAFFAVVFAWFAILFTGRYPKGVFDYVVGVGRWGLRVHAYAFLLRDRSVSTVPTVERRLNRAMPPRSSERDGHGARAADLSAGPRDLGVVGQDRMTECDGATPRSRRVAPCGRGSSPRTGGCRRRRRRGGCWRGRARLRRPGRTLRGRGSLRGSS